MLAKDIMTKDVLSIGLDTNVIDAVTMMRENGIHSLPVMDGKKYVGMILSADLIRRRSLHTKSKISNFIRNTPLLSPNSDVGSIIGAMKDSGISALPVVDDRILLGIVTKADIIRNFEGLGKFSGVTSVHIMSPDPVYVTPEDPVDVAMEKLRELEEYEIPVCSEDGKLEGILRFEDAMKLILKDPEKITYGQYTNNKTPTKVIVGSIMNEDAHSVSIHDNVVEAAKIMNKYYLHIVPVLDENNKINGVIGMNDLLDLITPAENNEGLLVNVTGLDHNDDDLYDITYFLTDKFAQRFLRIAGVPYGTFDIHVIRYKTEGSVKYSLRTRLSAGKYFMSINSYGWNFGRCLSEILDDYESRLRKIKEQS
ncbi:MAG: CBS domain-containing protein [Thermoplasmataceae archaeon]|jgi:CBS domain-containing protein